MATARDPELDATEGAIFARLWESHEDGLTPELAQHILKLKFPERDQARMHELATRNQDGELSAAELREFDNYIKVGDLIAILQSKARQRLKRSTATVRRHG
jgi:hypothetical protein